MELKTREEQIAALRALIEEQKRDLAELNAQLEAALDPSNKGSSKAPEGSA